VGADSYTTSWDLTVERGFAIETCAMDRGYDVERVYGEWPDPLSSVRPV